MNQLQPLAYSRYGIAGRLLRESQARIGEDYPWNQAVDEVISQTLLPVKENGPQLPAVPHSLRPQRF